jgi:hypothetical protein
MRGPASVILEPGDSLLAALEEYFKKYLALDAGLPLVLALWSLATHLFDCFDAFPYLAITSPTKRCGKTRLAEIVEMLGCNGERLVGATAATIFRTIQSHELEGGTVTLIMDEAEVLGTKSDRSEALREILNAGYRKGQSVPRCERNSQGTFEVQHFSVYCPKVIVLIGNLSDTLADRCIPIAMRRRKPGEQVERFFYRDAMRKTRYIRKESERWAKASRRKVKRYLRQDVDFLEDREAELWSPLFSVCAVAAPERLDHLKAIALRISGAKQADEPNDMGVLLLRDIRDVFEQNQQDRLPTFGLLMALSAIAESPWATWCRGSPLDARRLARLLRPFGVMPHNLRLEDNSVIKGYQLADFQEVWATYLSPDSAATPLQAP